MDAILLVLRTEIRPVERAQWHRRVFVLVSAPHLQEWEQAGVFTEIWRQGLLEYDQVVGIDWSFLSADGAMAKAPLGGAKTGSNPTDRAKRGRSARSSPEAAGVPIGLDHDGANRNDHKLLKGTLDSIPIRRPKPTKAGAAGPLPG